MKKTLSLFAAAFCCWCYQLNTIYAFNTAYLGDKLNEKLNAFKNEFGTTVNGFLGFFLVSSILIMIIHFIRLGQHGDKPALRAKVMNDMMITGVCTAVIGSLWFVYGLVMAIALG